MQQVREPGLYESVADIEADMATDESELISIFQRKHENKARFAESIRERQQKMMDINEGIRRHDLRQVREEELDRVKA